MTIVTVHLGSIPACTKYFQFEICWSDVTRNVPVLLQKHWEVYTGVSIFLEEYLNFQLRWEYLFQFLTVLVCLYSVPSFIF